MQDRSKLPSSQARLLSIIETHQSRFHYPPTFREIADTMGLASTGSVRKQIDSLVSKGFIAKRGPNMHRGMKVIG